MTDPGVVCYKIALSRASARDLSGAIHFARLAVCVNPDNDKARRLLDLCFYELGWSDETKLDTVRALTAKKKWRKAEAAAKNIAHQSVRVLMVRGCLLASLGRYAAAAAMFARALEKDRGNTIALQYLTETAARRGRGLFSPQ